jgi:hypothetical protein
MFQRLTATVAAWSAANGVQTESKMDATKTLLRVLGRAHKNMPQILHTSLLRRKPDKPDKSRVSL